MHSNHAMHRTLDVWWGKLPIINGGFAPQNTSEHPLESVEVSKTVELRSMKEGHLNLKEMDLSKHPVETSVEDYTNILPEGSTTEISSESEDETSMDMDTEMKEIIDEEFKGIKKRLEFVENSGWKGDLCLSFSTP